MIKKSRKQFVPDELKDDKYWARRRKNNIAAKRSRDARRQKENQIAMRARYLEKEVRQNMYMCETLCVCVYLLQIICALFLATFEYLLHRILFAYFLLMDRSLNSLPPFAWLFLFHPNCLSICHSGTALCEILPDFNAHQTMFTNKGVVTEFNVAPGTRAAQTGEYGASRTPVKISRCLNLLSLCRCPRRCVPVRLGRRDCRWCDDCSVALFFAICLLHYRYLWSL